MKVLITFLVSILIFSCASLSKKPYDLTTINFSLKPDTTSNVIGEHKTDTLQYEASIWFKRKKIQVDISITPKDNLIKKLAEFSNEMNWLKENKKLVLMIYNTEHGPRKNGKIIKVHFIKNGEFWVYLKNKDSTVGKRRVRIIDEGIGLSREQRL